MKLITCLLVGMCLIFSTATDAKKRKRGYKGKRTNKVRLLSYRKYKRLPLAYKAFYIDSLRQFMISQERKLKKRGLVSYSDPNQSPADLWVKSLFMSTAYAEVKSGIDDELTFDTKDCPSAESQCVISGGFVCRGTKNGEEGGRPWCNAVGCPDPDKKTWVLCAPIMKPDPDTKYGKEFKDEKYLCIPNKPDRSNVCNQNALNPAKAVAELEKDEFETLQKQIQDYCNDDVVGKRSFNTQDCNVLKMRAVVASQGKKPPKAPKKPTLGPNEEPNERRECKRVYKLPGCRGEEAEFTLRMIPVNKRGEETNEPDSDYFDIEINQGPYKSYIRQFKVNKSNERKVWVDTRKEVNGRFPEIPTTSELDKEKLENLRKQGHAKKVTRFSRNGEYVIPHRTISDEQLSLKWDFDKWGTCPDINFERTHTPKTDSCKFKTGEGSVKTGICENSNAEVDIQFSKPYENYDSELVCFDEANEDCNVQQKTNYLVRAFPHFSKGKAPKFVRLRGPRAKPSHPACYKKEVFNGVVKPTPNTIVFQAKRNGARDPGETIRIEDVCDKCTAVYSKTLRSYPAKKASDDAGDDGSVETVE